MGIDKQGFEPCELCGNLYHISDPNTCGTSTERIICKKCWIEVNEKTSWGAEVKKKIVFDYIKVSIPHSLKWEVWKNDNFTCLHCGSKDNLSVDHINPESYGGTLDIENLQTLCRYCNSKKSNNYG
jgi:5-methylcytosine-specific restriction endonuclease McrA